MFSKQEIDEIVTEFEGEQLSYEVTDEEGKVGVAQEVINVGIREDEYLINTEVRIKVDEELMSVTYSTIVFPKNDSYYDMSLEDFYDELWDLLSEYNVLEYGLGKNKAIAKRDRMVKRMESKNRVKNRNNI